MRCIEMLKMFAALFAGETINSNMRCIEMEETLDELSRVALINSNMRCIEMTNTRVWMMLLKR